MTRVDYVLHARVGTTVVSVSYPPDMTSSIRETFQLVADGKDTKYQTSTYVADGNDKVDIMTYAVATAADGTVSKTFKQNGHVNRLINFEVSLKH